MASVLDAKSCCTDGKCEYMYRMQNTVDHTNIADLARIVGVSTEQHRQAEETMPVEEAQTTTSAPTA